MKEGNQSRVPDWAPLDPLAIETLREKQAFKVPNMRDMRDVRRVGNALLTSDVVAPAKDGHFHVYCGFEQATALQEDNEFARHEQSIPDYAIDRESAFAKMMCFVFHYAKPKDARLPEFTIGAFGIPPERQLAQIEGNGRVMSSDGSVEPRETLAAALTTVLNSYSRENGSNTPDVVLARYVVQSLAALDVAIGDRDRWYGRVQSPGLPDPKDERIAELEEKLAEAEKTLRELGHIKADVTT